MRVVVITDIHGNCIALDAVLADLTADRARHPTDLLVCLGDAVQGGPQPAEVVARLRDLGCPVVMGNADAWLLSGVATGEEPVSARQEAVRQWSLGKLSPDDRAFVAGFLPTISVPLAGGERLLCFHGSPHSFDDVLLPSTADEEVERLLGADALGAAAASPPAVLAGGHTHVQYLRRVGDALFFNPGSVGLAYSHRQPEGEFRADPWAEYAVLSRADDGRLALEFRRVPLDAAALVAAARASGRPHAEDVAVQYSPRAARHSSPG